MCWKHSVHCHLHILTCTEVNDKKVSLLWKKKDILETQELETSHWNITALNQGELRFDFASDWINFHQWTMKVKYEIQHSNFEEQSAECVWTGYKSLQLITETMTHSSTDYMLKKRLVLKPVLWNDAWVPWLSELWMYSVKAQINSLPWFSR